jgi:dihydrofolate reductase
MGIVRVAGFSVSMDGFGAGPNQELKNPLGVRGMELHQWAFKTKTFRKMFGQEGGSTGIDNGFAEKAATNLGAWILGRNMFSPGRGAWDESWKGWWGDNPPYHCDVFVLTHYPRKPLPMEGGTVFHFVTDGIESALKQAKASAKNKDVRIGGGVSTIRQYLQAGLIDEMHLAYAPVYLGVGENLLSGLNLTELGFNQAERTEGENATHLTLKRKI